MKRSVFACAALGVAALFAAPVWQSHHSGDRVTSILSGQFDLVPSAQAQDKKRRTPEDRRDRRDRVEDRRDDIEDRIEEEQRENRREARRVARRTARRVSNRHDHYNELPPGCTDVVINGYPYFYCGGVYYQSALDENDVTVYVIVNP